MTESALDERFSGVLAPDTILPTQFAGFRRGGHMSGERRLMVAILEDALHCFQKHVDAIDPKHRQLFAEAEEWISTDNPTWFFSFSNVCDMLDLNPAYVREGLSKWRDARRRDAASDADLVEEPLRRASNA